ncbi:MAG: hypothetical protein ABIQ88_06115 [Chitinophagaceae bacterium]
MYQVLIADADVDAWFRVNAMLRRYLVKASFVTNLNAARLCIDKQPPAILFFDNHLQHNFTPDFIRYVKMKYPQVKIILVNSIGASAQRFKTSVDMVISKPFLPEIIEHAIIKLFYPQQPQMQSVLQRAAAE